MATKVLAERVAVLERACHDQGIYVPELPSAPPEGLSPCSHNAVHCVCVCVCVCVCIMIAWHRTGDFLKRMRTRLSLYIYA